MATAVPLINRQGKQPAHWYRKMVEKSEQMVYYDLVVTPH